jgi:hypothetical protein
MTNLARYLALLLLTAGPAYADGGCPPGMIPYSGNDLSSCGPIPPGYYGSNSTGPQPATLPPEWSSRWGAIATYAPTGVLGVSNDALSKEAAERAALNDCQSKGGLNCKIEVAYDNECAAVVVGDQGYVVTSNPFQDAAIKAGIGTCGGSENHCHAYYAACSRPVRIR